MDRVDRKEIYRSYWLFCFLLLLAAISYSNTLYSPFILDDYSAFINNKNLYLQDLSFASLKQLVKTRFGYARVIPIASFALNHYIGQGKSVVSYHVTNIVVHLLATISLAYFISGLLKTSAARNTLEFFRPAYFILAVCGLWALAPVQTNAVTYLVQRMTSMAAMFYFAACGFYIHARLAGKFLHRVFLYLMFLLAALGGFFSKENSFTLPAAILLVEFLCISPHLGAKLVRSIRWYHWLIFIVAALVVYPLLENYVNSTLKGFSARHFTVSERLLTEPRIVIFYLSLLLLPLPSRMNLEHDFSLSTSLISPPSTLLSFFFIALLFAAAVFHRKKYPLISFGIFWFFLNLLIESSFIPLELIFEHRIYLPSAGFFLVTVALLDNLLSRFDSGSDPQTKKVVFLLFIIMLSASSILTSLRNNDWRDKIALYRDSMEKSPAKARAVSNYAMALGKAGMYEECVTYGLQVQSLGVQGYEDYMNSANNILSCLLFQGKSKEAVEVGEKIRQDILQKDLEFIEAGSMRNYMFNLASAYADEKEYRKAFDTFQIALFRAPGDIQTYRAVNRMLLAAQNDEDGRKELVIGKELAEIPVKLAKIAYNYRQYEYMAAYLNDAIKLKADPAQVDPLNEKLLQTLEKNRIAARASSIRFNETFINNPLFRFYMKAVNYILRKYKPLRGATAGFLLKRAEKIDPENPFIQVYRSRWHLANGRIDKTVNELELFTETNKDFVPALELLVSCYQRKKNYEKSVAILSHILDIYHGHKQWANYQSFIYQYEDLNVETKRSPLDYY